MSDKPRFEFRYWDGGQVIYTKGNLTAEEFRDGVLFSFNCAIEVELKAVSQSYARLCGVWEDGEMMGHYLDYPVEAKRGAFLITYAEQFECDEIAFDKYGLYCRPH